MFNSILGIYPKRKFKIELEPDVVPYHCDRPSAIPQKVIEIIKKKLEFQVEIGVLYCVYEIEWGIPVFVVPKIYGSIRMSDDFFELNKHVIHQN